MLPIKSEFLIDYLIRDKRSEHLIIFLFEVTFTQIRVLPKNNLTSHMGTQER
jgi:hypothetical protein